MTETTTTLNVSTTQLLKASTLALIGAGLILLIAVLPAEYGIDPTGIGKALGLTALHTPAEEAEEVADEAASVSDTAVSKAGATVIRQSTPYQSGEMTLTLLPESGAEIKAQMHAGDTIVFSWISAGGPVSFDMHGEKPNDGNNFTSYWQGRDKNQGHGSFTAPFSGSQGWYWQNDGSGPVSITVKVSGYFEKLYKPY